MTVLMLLLIWLSNGMFPKLHMSGYIRIAMLVVAVVGYLAYHRRKVVLLRKYFELFFLLIALQIITIAINGFYPALDIFLMLSLGCTLLWCSNISKNEFVDGYRNAILIISVISVALYFVGMFTNIFRQIPGAFLNTANAENTYTILGTFVVKFRNTYTYYRNYGIFSEPGQFQIFLSMGLIFELFYYDDINWKRLFIYLITYATCDSTNGYITAALIVLAYLAQHNTKDSSHKEKMLKRGLTAGCIVVLIAAIFTYNSNSFLIGILDKLSGLSSSYTYADVGTGLERRRAFDVAIDMFLQNPITGLGYAGMQNYKLSLSKTNFIMTCSPLNWFARFGLIYGVVANICYIGGFVRRENGMCKVLLIAAIISMISAQAIGADIVANIMLFYGFSSVSQIAEQKKEGRFRA